MFEHMFLSAIGGDMQVFYSEAIPRETLYLMPSLGAFSIGPTLFQRDPWPDPPRAFGEPYLTERAKALGFLADLLDDTYESLGWDPEEWREAKWRESQQIEWDRMRFMTHERIALSVLRPPGSTIITGTVS